MGKLRAIWLAIAMIAASNAGGWAAIRTETIEYKQGDTPLEGYLAYDDSLSGKRPGVLVVHEWTGLGAYVKGRAEQLAKEGFVAFAPDIYGKGVRPSNPKDAGQTSGLYMSNRPLMRERVRAGFDVLLKDPRVDPRKVAAIGYCFGGAVALELARSGAPLAGVVSFHGALDTPHPEDAKNIKGKVLALHGGNDPFVTQEKVDGFCKEMRDAGVDWQLDVYGGAVHGFTNPEHGNDPSAGAAYNADADRRSWKAMMDFFAEIFR